MLTSIRKRAVPKYIYLKLGEVYVREELGKVYRRLARAGIKLELYRVGEGRRGEGKVDIGVELGKFCEG